MTQVDAWIDDLTLALAEEGTVPLHVLLYGLERERKDDKATPNVFVVRATEPGLREFEPERLIARLKAAENVIGRRWMEVNDDSGEVIMHQTAEQIISELERNIEDLMPEAAEVSETA